jgi:comEA protein
MIKNILSKVLLASVISLNGLITLASSARAETKDSHSFMVAKKDKKAKMETKMEAKSDKKMAAKIAKKPAKKPVPVKTTAMLNLNKATEADLKKLPGIGDKLAKNIVVYRTKHGDFKSIDDLKKVEGIGDKTLVKIKTEVSI